MTVLDVVPHEFGSQTIVDAQPSLDFIAGSLWGAEIHAQIGQRYAELGDLAGLNYSIRCLTAYTRAALSTLGDLRELRDRQEAASVAKVRTEPELA